MTNKLVVVINRLKCQKLRKNLPHEMMFLVPNYSCLQNPWLGGCCPQIPVLSVLCPQPNLLNPPPNKIPGYATALDAAKKYGLNETARQLFVGFRGVCNVLLKKYLTAWGICVKIFRLIKECFNRYRVCRVQFLLAASWNKEMLYRRCF